MMDFFNAVLQIIVFTVLDGIKNWNFPALYVVLSCFLFRNVKGQIN